VGGGSFLLGIMLVGAIPGDQVILSDVLTATWAICTVVGIRSSHAAFWRSPLAVWAVVAMTSTSIARWFLSDATVIIFLLIWTIGLLVAVIWWYRVSRRDSYLLPNIPPEDPSSTDVINTVPNEESRTPTPRYRRWLVIGGGLSVLLLVPLSLYLLNQPEEDPAESELIFDAIGDQLSSTLTPTQQSDLCAIVDDLGDDILTNADPAYDGLRRDFIGIARRGVSNAGFEITDAGETEYLAIGSAALEWFCLNR